mmetsp:Transcript_31730/g.98980  ORF Transcript_31730/g.98980 Transcript_31730/m.98980 type:complete len:211 (+) Transcript_31730:2623-3255(+)
MLLMAHEGHAKNVANVLLLVAGRKDPGLVELRHAGDGQPHLAREEGDHGTLGAQGGMHREPESNATEEDAAEDIAGVERAEPTGGCRAVHAQAAGAGEGRTDAEEESADRLPRVHLCHRHLSEALDILPVLACLRICEAPCRHEALEAQACIKLEVLAVVREEPCPCPGCRTSGRGHRHVHGCCGMGAGSRGEPSPPSSARLPPGQSGLA